MALDKIVIKGARTHNLKDIDVTIPRDKFVVVTGLSGSGKSSLAFDTVYAEGQRRYVESLSAYARQFLGQMDKPDVDSIDGLSPAISIDQKTTNRNPRSTVGTVTEIYDYLRLLFARIGQPYCPTCNIKIASQTVEQMVDQVMTLPDKTRIQVLAPVIRGRKGEHVKLLEQIQKEGYVRVRINGETYDVTDLPSLNKNQKHSIEVVIDRLVMKEGIESRLADSFETALKLAEGLLLVDVIDGEEMLFSQLLACPQCGYSSEELAPRMFSFNSPFGACDSCSGIGIDMVVDEQLVIPHPDMTINEGAILPWAGSTSNYYPQLIKAVCAKFDIDIDKAWQDLTRQEQDIILYGVDEEIEFIFDSERDSGVRKMPRFEGVIGNLNRRYHETGSELTKEFVEGFMSSKPCDACQGERLKPQSLAVYVGGQNISYVTALTISEAVDFFTGLELTDKEESIARLILKEINERLSFLRDVGLDYLNLSRSAGTLSGGEAQRIRLATQIGSSLMGVLYILDEPSIGLHQRDNHRLISALERMRDLGNTLIIVEHDEDTMLAADWIIDIGPGAGAHGGQIVAEGPPEKLMKNKKSITGLYLSGQKFIELPEARREPILLADEGAGLGQTVKGNLKLTAEELADLEAIDSKEAKGAKAKDKSAAKSKSKKKLRAGLLDEEVYKVLTIHGAGENNLKDIDVSIPLGTLTCVTGVSGSGKSSLVNGVLQKSLAKILHRAKDKPGQHREITGLGHLDKVIDINQAPIGRTPRSNPATYTGVFDDIRDVYASTNEAKVRGYKKGRFSFNVRGGRCEACRGDGIIKIEMHFLPDVYVPCEICKGKRYNRETLEIKYKDKTIADVLDMTIEEALDFFQNIPKIKRKLETIYDVGLGYIKLGQPATTLSGGEAQRVKLASELHRRSNGKTLYILDEPTTGLHIDDISRLLQVLQRLVDNGDTVLVIEHNLDVIKVADYIIDLGPEGGDGGGRIVATGTPEEVAKVKASYTGSFLGPILERDRARAKTKK